MRTLHRGEQRPDTLEISNHLVRAELAFAKDAVHECNRNLPHRVPQGPCAHHHLHLEHVASRLCERDDMPQDGQTVESSYVSRCGPHYIGCTYRKLPVRSLTPGLSTVSAKKLAPLETSFRLMSQPCTPPGRVSDIEGVGVDRYRVPVTMSKLYACCRLWGEASAGSGWWVERTSPNELWYEFGLVKWNENLKAPRVLTHLHGVKSRRP